MKIKMILGNELVIESDHGKAKVKCNFNGDLEIQGESVLRELGLPVGDVIAMYFDRVEDESIKKKYPLYRERLAGKR